MKVEGGTTLDRTAFSYPEVVTPDEGRPRPAFARLLAEVKHRRLSGAEVGIGSAEGRETVYTVRQGDTLSQIIETVMRRTDVRVSPPAIYRAVKEVATANRIANPDRIYPGQAIDLSAVASGAESIERHAAPAHDETVAEAGPAAVVRDLKAFMQSFAGRFTSAFGPRTDPVTGLPAFHAGVDIRLPTGSFIYPALPGRVVFSGSTRGYGNLVILAHAGGLTTSYGHNSSNLIPTGVVVDRAMPIAIVGATGRATGPHLHFEVRKDGHPMNPNMSRLELRDQDGREDL